MPIFSSSYSLFSKRRQMVSRHLERCEYFFPSWVLLRIRTEKSIEKSKGRCYHWQRDLYICRAKGRARKLRKSYPKNPKRSISPYKQAWHWASSHVPLNSSSLSFS